ncbi:MAG: type II toxin-antitoxin system VapC family toxin [candidate division KSB1 bacterium]|nr:type II toxin-antitoxin system VapC family toxin [candidate division KSB1 bacterium]
MKWVVDCSFVAALFLPDEASDSVDQFFSKLSAEDELIVPTLWQYELANVLILAEKKKRLDANQVKKIFDLIEQLNFQVDYNEVDSHKLYELGRQFNLTTYDAVYLEAAMRYNAGLATLDKPLAHAAQKCNLIVV